MTPAAIAVVEPQMHNLFHAPFNAALLHAVVLAYPELRVSFRARPEHAAAVRGILERNCPAIVSAIEWRGMTQRSDGSLAARWCSNSRMFSEVLNAGERVLFCSISRMQLLQLKRHMKPNQEVRAVLHGDLDRIEGPVTDRFPMSLFALQKVLRGRQPRGLRYVLMSDSIRRAIPAQFAPAMQNACVIDHPYHFPQVLPAPPGEVVFGIFGNCGDGRLLERVARAVRAAAPHIGFRLVGFLGDRAAVERLSPLVEGTGTLPISADAFLQGARAVTYALWLSKPDAFRLRASGTFMDALAFGKPLVYTANEFIDPYHALAPGIGTRCETIDDVPAAVVAVARAHREAEYREAQRAIVNLRVRFAPESLAPRLGSCLDFD